MSQMFGARKRSISEVTAADFEGEFIEQARKNLDAITPMRN
ncbi:hypothetical protein ACIQ2D_21680 [Lysinibacillus sp. NPDC097287]